MGKCYGGQMERKGLKEKGIENILRLPRCLGKLRNENISWISHCDGYRLLR